MAAQHPDNPVGQFCYYHFSRIARLLRTQHPLYRRDLMPGQHRLPFWPALLSYLSFKSTALRNAARLGVTLAVGSSLGAVFNLPKPYWILLTIMLVSQNGYNATRVRIQHRALGTIAGLLLAAGLLQLQLPEGETLSIMLVITLLAYLVSRKNYGLSVIGFTVTAVYTLQLLALNGSHFLVPRLIDTLIGCVLAFGGTIWLWPQWQSGLLRKNAHQALENDRRAAADAEATGTGRHRVGLYPHAGQPGAQRAVHLAQSGDAGAGVRVKLSGGHAAVGHSQPVHRRTPERHDHSGARALHADAETGARVSADL